MTFLSSLWAKPSEPSEPCGSASAPGPASIGGGGGGGGSVGAKAEAAGAAAGDAAALCAAGSCEAEALRAALRELAGALDAPGLPACDAWSVLLRSPGRRAEMVLRVLRYQACDVGRSVAQVRAILAWRAATRVCDIGADAMRGPAAGLPVVFVPVLGAGRRTLLYACARFYIKRDVTAAATSLSLVRFFEQILYAADGARAASAVAVVDFCDVSIRETDLPTVRKGINLFLQYYPECFSKLLFVNFPRFIFSFWKLIKPLLDGRTVERVEWCETPQDVTKELETWFSRDQIPKWLGGTCDKRKPELLIGASMDESELIKMFAPSSAV